MSSLPNHFVTRFDTEVKRQYQYAGKLSLEGFYVKSGRAQVYHFNKQGIMYSSEHVPNASLVLSYNEKSRESINIKFYDVASTVDETEQAQLNYNETSQLLQECKDAIARRKDSVILDAITATTTTNAIAKNVSGAIAGLTVKALIDTSNLMDTNNFPSDGRVVLCSPKQMHNLTNELKVSSIDFNSVKPMVSGSIYQFYGFNIITIPTFQVVEGIDAGLPDDTGAANSNPAYAFCMGGKACPVGVAVNEDISVRTAVLPDRGYAEMIYAKLGIASKIIDETQIVKIDCAANI